MRIEYNTNMTSISSRALDLWGKFRSIFIGASIDGYGAIFEYQRYPANWEKVLRNLQKVDAAPGNLHAWLAYTVTVYNVLHMPDFMRWKIEHSGFERFNNSNTRPVITHHVAHNPPYLNIRVLPADYKQLVLSKFNALCDWTVSSAQPAHVVSHVSWVRDSVCGYMLAEDTYDRHWADLVWHTKKLDDIRHQDISDVCPELARYMP